MNYKIEKNILNILLFINTVIVASVLRIRVYPAPEADYQTYIKLAVWCISLGVSMMFYKVWLSKLLRADNILLTIFLLINLLSIFYAPLFYFSVGTFFTVLCVFIFMYTTCSMLETKQVFNTVFTALSFVTIISIIVYFVNPEFGRYREWHNGVLTIGTRLCGITGTANHIGFITSFATLISYYMYQNNYIKHRLIYYSFSIINIIGLVMSHSRTSMAALIISIVFATLMRPTYSKLAFTFLLITISILSLLLIDMDELFSLVSRSGEASEITSGTGRSDIWAVVIRLIEERPLQGYGYASSLQILDEVKAEVGFKAASAHNLILQILLNAGLVSLILFIAAYFIKGYTALRNNDRFIISGLVFILIVGASESVVFQGTANTSTLAFALIFGIKYVTENKNPPI